MTTNSNSAESTLYPKITNHISEIVERLQELERDPQHPEAHISLTPIPIVGTVKLHGTHADILVHANDDIVFQSRNLTSLSTAKDNAGFAAAMSNKTNALLQLRNLYLARWSKLNPTKTLHQHHPVLVAGEWIGSKIQKDVCISQLSRRFVIISVKIDGVWQNDQEYADISLEDDDIYNVSRAGLYRATLHTEDLALTVSRVETLAEEVAARCPFAATFGLTGLGEGIVWKLTSPKYNANPSLWFKTKGGKFKPQIFKQPRQTLADGALRGKRRAARLAAETWCSAQRLEQGWDVLKEKGVKRDGGAAGEYLDWVTQDVLVEEKTRIKDEGVDKSVLVVEIGKIARAWYDKQIREEADCL